MSSPGKTDQLWWLEPFDPSLSLGELILCAGRRYSDRRAVELEDGTWLTHGALHANAEPVRREIAGSIAERGGAVACFTTTNEKLTIALIASLTSASSTTFLDTSTPPARNRQSMSAIGARTLLADRTTLAYARSVCEEGDRIIMLDEPEKASGFEDIPVPDKGVLTIFTSGSTGEAKGVLRPYLAMAHTAYNLSWRCESSPDDVMLYVGSPGHVGTLNDVLLCVLNGFAAVPVQLIDLDLRSIYRKIDELGVNKVAMPPSLMRLLLRHAAANTGFRRDLLMCSSGEALLRSDVRLFFEVLGPNSKLWQSYGSTEAGHMVAGYYRPEHAIGPGSLPLNSPTRGVEIEILDDKENPVEPGQTGQIRVRTPAMALGYTTKDSNEEHGFGQDERGRYFKTGDRATLLEPGVFVIEGRADRQVNMHGRRIELGEIESTILGIPGWGEACASLVPDETGRQTLMAMVSPTNDSGCQTGVLRRELREKLPDFAIPSQIVSSPALPRTTTGKVDLAAVRIMLANTLVSSRARPGQPALGPTENWVADAWQTVLGVMERPSRDIAFDEFGGDSLNAVELCLRFDERFGVELGMDFVTAHRTIKAQASALQDAASGRIDGQRVVTLRADGEGPICVLVPGAGGHAWVYLGIADAMQHECDLLALNLNFSTAAELHVDRIGHAVLNAISPKDRSRPVLIVGYSRGSLIACSLAEELLARGLNVAALAMIDPSPTRAESSKDKLSGSIKSLLSSASRNATKAEANKIIDEQINRTRREIAKLYRPERTRLPDLFCSVMGTSETLGELRSRGHLFGRRLAELNIEQVEDFNHLDLMRKRGAPIVAAWLEQILIQISATRIEAR